MDFQLETLRLENFRCYSSAVLSLDDQLTVLIADNGHGKSAALDAIAICLGQLLGPLQLKPRRPISERLQISASDATTSYALPPYAASSFPVVLEAAALVDGERTTWTGTASGADSEPRWSIDDIAEGVAAPRTMKLGPDVTLPVFAYYGTNRTLANVVQTKPPSLGHVHRGFGYQNSLRAGEGLDELGPWLAQGEWERSGRGTSIWDAALDAVYQAATQVLGSHGVSRVRYSMEDRDLVLDFGLMEDDEGAGFAKPVRPGSAVVPMRLTADGYRSILGLVADLAFRCGALNHHLGAEAPQLTSGLVLIDEIDMHLHPTWQTHVLRDLAQAFPRIQFVVSTHSPFVLSSVSGESVRQIESLRRNSWFVSTSRSTEGARIETLTESLLNAPVRADGPVTVLLESLAAALEGRDLRLAAMYAEELEAYDPPVSDPDAIGLISELRWRQQADDRSDAGS